MTDYGPSAISAWAHQHLKNVSESGAWLEACCPIHNDSSPSLRINLETGGAHCHAGCDILPKGTVWNLAAAANLPDPPDLSPLEKRQDKITFYVYNDEDGKPHRVAKRVDYAKAKPKDVFPGIPDENGGWNCKKGAAANARKLLYHLDEIVARPGERVYFVEGEKVADYLRGLGVLATCTPGGSNGALDWREFTPLAGREVVVCPDNDDPGRKYAKKVLDKLRQIGPPAKSFVLETPTVLKGGDLFDWGRSRSELDELALQDPAEWMDAHLPKQTKPPPNRKLAYKYHRTDLGNAEMLIDRYGQDLRYCPAFKAWMVWRGGRWVESNFAAQHLANKVARERLAEAELAGEDTPEEMKHAFKSEEAGANRACLTQAQSIPGVIVEPTDMDLEPWILNVRNGTIDLKTGKLMEPEREHLCTKQAPMDYDPDAKCPQWLAFLKRILDGDEEVLSFLQRAMGYSLTGSTAEQVLLFLHGSGANGKSTFLEVFLKILGDYARKADFESFLEQKRGSGPREDLADLHGARFVPSTEVEEGRRLAEAVVKELVGGDTLSVRRLYQARFCFTPVAKLFLAANVKPEIRSNNLGTWRRIIFVPFTVTIPKPDRVRDLSGKLVREEGPGILAWAVRGCLDWQRRGLDPPESIRKATDSYREEQDLLGGFIEACCEEAEDYTCPAKALHGAYNYYCGKNGEAPVSKKAFSSLLSQRGFKPGRNKAERFWAGLRLIPPAPRGSHAVPTEPEEDPGLHPCEGCDNMTRGQSPYCGRCQEDIGNV